MSKQLVDAISLPPEQLGLDQPVMLDHATVLGPLSVTQLAVYVATIDLTVCWRDITDERPLVTHLTHYAATEGQEITNRLGNTQVAPYHWITDLTDHPDAKLILLAAWGFHDATDLRKSRLAEAFTLIDEGVRAERTELKQGFPCRYHVCSALIKARGIIGGTNTREAWVPFHVMQLRP